MRKNTCLGQLFGPNVMASLLGSSTTSWRSGASKRLVDVPSFPPSKHQKVPPSYPNYGRKNGKHVDIHTMNNYTRPETVPRKRRVSGGCQGCLCAFSPSFLLFRLFVFLPFSLTLARTRTRTLTLTRAPVRSYIYSLSSLVFPPPSAYSFVRSFVLTVGTLCIGQAIGGRVAG